MAVQTYDSLRGQTVLVTGATRGIGAAVAEELSGFGAIVYAGARRPSDVSVADVRPLRLDVTDDASIDAAVGRIETEAGRLDVLANNAGVAGPDAPLHEADVEAIDATLGTNLRGPVVLTRRALPLLLAREGGRVVNVSSGMGALGEGMGGGSPAYRISKTGLNGLTAYLHGEYAAEGLLANAVCPGWVRTDMGGASAPRSPEEGADTVAWLARFRPGGPSGRFWRDRERIPW
ncbi:SDR family NAD(P)-dependent oxidoreductase [Haloarculaceae archaeon H-GB2-1]|nr:SDR family NAD(P)-dependent oxidoreductase [Haloarculaceae archaeon H-GB1-1]MEA5386059.1 SDR family NAD(P)-dependent oxidoreductase [Haloarculaceae archaeon H-GB11]MEA5407566.1 SDR family NAD(P)-dependent oxidoreductase [Haloarculaceae archaeon H-GB2-1]